MLQCMTKSLKKCIKNKVKFIERSKESVTIDGPAIKIHNYFKIF